MARPDPEKEGGEFPLLKKKLRIRSASGLHARPAAVFVQVASRFKADVWVRKGRREVDGKSIMGILTLAAEKGSIIEIKAHGPDAEHALLALTQLLARDELPAVVHIVKHKTHHDSTPHTRS